MTVVNQPATLVGHIWRRGELYGKLEPVIEIDLVVMRLYVTLNWDTSRQFRELKHEFEFVGKINMVTCELSFYRRLST